MAQDASGAQHSAEDRDGAQIVRTGTDARQGEIIMDKGDLLVWSAAAVVVLLIALLVAY
jgi:molybdopterin biosynthesis enzyme